MSVNNLTKLRYTALGSVFGGGIYYGFSNYAERQAEQNASTPKAVFLRLSGPISGGKVRN